jgi:hypothetical protein
MKYVAPVSFFGTIWIVVIGQILQHLSNPIYYILVQRIHMGNFIDPRRRETLGAGSGHHPKEVAATVECLRKQKQCGVTCIEARA